MAYRGYSVANGLMVDANGFGDFTTIGAAITAATSGKNIFIRPGTYVENITVKAGVNLSGFQPNSGDAVQASGPAIINGKITFSTAGDVSIFGLILKTNGDFVIANTSTGALGVNECTLLMTNNTGISVTSTGLVNLLNCNGSTSTSGISIHSMSGNGLVNYTYCSFDNSGGTTTASTNSNGTVGMGHSGFNHPFTCSGTGNFVAFAVKNNSSTTNSTAFTLNGSGIQTLEYCSASGGTASAVSIGGTAAILYSDISSSNVNAVTGAGTLNRAFITFTGSSAGHNVATENGFPTLI